MRLIEDDQFNTYKSSRDVGFVVDMGEGSVYGSEVDMAHRVGDLHIDEADQLTGFWASWSYDAILNKNSNPEISKTGCGSPAKLIGIVSSFLNRVGIEWSGFQRIIGLDHYLSETATEDKSIFEKELEGFISGVADEMKHQNASFHLFLGFVDKGDLGNPREKNDSPLRVQESLFRSFTLNEGCSPKITPIVQLKDLDWGSEHNRAIFEAAAKYGTPFYIRGSQANTGEKCAINDPWINGCSQGINTGVIGLVTLNLPRVAYQSKDESIFFERVDELLDLARNGLENKRSLISDRMNKGGMPITLAASGSFDGYFDAIGIVGVHETLLNLFGKGIESMQGKAVAYKLLEQMNDRIEEFQKETGHPFCLTAIPSGNAPYRLAEMDRREYPEIKTSGVESPFYTNSSCLPVDYTDDLWDALEHQKKLQTFYNGGTIFNIYLDKEIEDIDGCIALTKKIDESFQVPCFAFSPVYRRDHKHCIYTEANRARTSTSHDTREYRRLELEYKTMNTFTKGELEEVRLRKPYAVVSGW